MPKSKKTPASATSRKDTKTVRTHEVRHSQRPSWRFSTVDLNGPFAWPVGAAIEVQILRKLQQFDSMNWRDIEGPDHHAIGVDRLSKEAQARLTEIKQSERKPALMISVHGGGGHADVVKSDEAFYRQGMATLMFDAYAMQGLPGRDSLFWARSVTNEARQRMIWATALAAYRWALTRTDIDTSRIYLFGISNGAAVVANMAAVVDPAHVRGVISEGVTPIGLGLPDEIKVPVLLVFGQLDDFGNPDPNGKRWTLSDDCSLNVLLEGLPAGSARTCNRQHRGQRIPTPQQWAEQIRQRGGPLEVLYVDDMAHSAFWGSLTRRRATWGNGQTLGASLGATPAARERFFQAMLDFIARTDR